MMTSLHQLIMYFCTPPICRRKLRRACRIAAATTGLVCLILFLALVQELRRPSSSLPLPSGDQSCSGEGKCDSSSLSKSHVRADFVHTSPHKYVRTNSRVKRILRWTGFFTDESWEEVDDTYFAPCQEHRCTVTNDRDLLDESDAVLFHVGALWNWWRGAPLPTRRHPSQVWILYNVEPPPRVPLDLSHFSGVFNWTAFYRRDSDVPVSYGGMTRFARPSILSLNTSLAPNWYRENNRFAAWMSSNCYDYNRRQVLVRQLKKLLGDKLDLYGACGQKRCPETICAETIANYKFFFTFENSNCKDYISEKFWSALQRRQVPVVMGGASSKDYAKIAPPHSFIHVGDFKTIESLVDYLRQVGSNETAYNNYLSWSFEADVYSELSARRKWWCDVCAALHDSSRPAQVYTDMAGWVADDVCPMWTWSNQIGRYVDGARIRLGLL